jgi:hypothetical protein
MNESFLGFSSRARSRKVRRGRREGEGGGKEREERMREDIFVGEEKQRRQR